MSFSIPILNNIKVHFKFIDEDLYFEDDKDSRNIYQVSVSYNGKSISFRFGDSIDNTRNGIKLDDEKDKASILETCYMDYSTTKENYPEIEDFAQEFGYDLNESVKKTRKIYNACIKQAEKLHLLFTDEEIEQIRKELDF